MEQSSDENEEIIEEAEVIEAEPTDIAIPDENLTDVKDIRTVRAVRQAGSIKCNICYLGDRCPFYAADKDCELGLKVQITDAKDLVDVLRQMIEAQSERVMRQMFIENVDGGVIDPLVSAEMANLFKLAEKLKNFLDTRDTVRIEAKGDGIIKQLFGDLGQK